MNIKELLHKALTIILPLGAMMGSLCLSSCEETAEIDEYADWKARNIEFVDSIAEVAKANADGKWLRILSFKLNDTDANGEPVEYDNEEYIYCHIEAVSSPRSAIPRVRCLTNHTRASSTLPPMCLPSLAWEVSS